VYQMEKVLRDNADKVDDAQRATVQGPLDDLKTALNGNDMDAIKAAHEKLMGASQAFSQQLYEKAAQDNAAGTSASGQTTNNGGDDEIIDAEIVDEQ
ncbi:MAG: Hsp70 family protein, partial [Ilumatobacteraceae bacterium]